MSLPIYLLWYCAIPAVPRAMRCVSVGGLWKSLGTLYSTFKTSSRNDTMVWFQLCAACGLSLLLVLALFRRFFSRFSGFPSSAKTNISKFQFDQDRKPARKPAKAHVASSLYIVIYLIYYIFYLMSVYVYIAQHKLVEWGSNLKCLTLLICVNP